MKSNSCEKCGSPRVVGSDLCHVHEGNSFGDLPMNLWDELKMTRMDFVKLPIKERLRLHREVRGYGIFDKCKPDNRNLFELWCEDNAEKQTILEKYPHAVI